MHLLLDCPNSKRIGQFLAELRTAEVGVNCKNACFCCQKVTICEAQIGEGASGSARLASPCQSRRVRILNGGTNQTIPVGWLEPADSEQPYPGQRHSKACNPNLLTLTLNPNP